MVRKEAPPRKNTAKKARGRGGFRGGYRGRGRGRGGGNFSAHILDLNVNDEKVPNIPETDNRKIIMESTLSACETPIISTKEPTQIFSDEQVEEITNKLKQLSLKDQMDIDFIVPLPPMEEGISIQPQNVAIKEEKQTEKPAEPKKEQSKDLDSWLDGLLGI